MFFAILVSLFLLGRAGHIYPHDVVISPNNKNTPSNITLIFTPETSLAPTDYLRIIFPFQLSSIQYAYWDIYADCSNAKPTRAAKIQESSLPDDTNTYFVQLYTDGTASELSNLTGNVTYFLQILANPVDNGKSDLSLPVQMFTISNNLGNWIVYDSNQVFGLTALADPYNNNMIVSLNIPPSQTNSKIPGESYYVEIDLTPNIMINNQARIDIELTNPSFTIISCDNATAQAQDVSEIPVTFVQLASNLMRAIVLEPLLAQDGIMYRFNCVIKNPSSPGLSSLRIQNRMGFVETVTEMGTSSVSLEAALIATPNITSIWDEAYHNVELAWGYQASAPGALSILSLYKDASASESWYQSTKTTFKPKTDLFSIYKLQLLVSTLADSGLKILTSTIYHNLPDFSSTEKVSCDVSTLGFITCSNVGSLTTQQYFISFRFALFSTTAAITTQDFGKVQVQTQTDKPITLIPLSQTTLLNQNINTNLQLYTNSGQQGVIAYATSKSNSQVRDYVSAGEEIILNFRFKYFSNQTIPLVLGQQNRGFELYTSTALPSFSSPNCSIGTLVESTDITTSNCEVVNNNGDKYTRLRFKVVQLLNNATGSPAALLFQSNPGDGTISFDSVSFASDKVSSLTIVNENIYDYYGRWIQGYDDSTYPPIATASGTSPFFFNSLVHQVGALSNLNVGTSFFITGQSAAGIGNNGSSFPTLIRIAGSLNATEQSSIQRLLVFFNDLEPLSLDTPCFGPDGIECKYEDNALLETTGTNSLTDYSGARRVEINIDFSQEFNVYIPVQTIAAKSQIGFFVIAASTINDTASSQGIFTTQYVKRINSSSFTNSITGNSIPIDAAGTSTPKVVIPSNASPGDIINSYISNIQGNYATSANTASNIGAAYGYCSDYNFTAADGFSFVTLDASGSSSLINRCVTMQYNTLEVKERICTVCPVGVTMPSTNALQITNFKLPSLKGVDFSGSTYIIGSNNGGLQKAVIDNQPGVLNPFKLLNHNITFLPDGIKQDSKNILTQFNFTPTFYLPQNISIVLSPVSPSNSFLLSPVIEYGCQALSINVSSCSITGNSTYIQINMTAESSTWPVVVHSIQFMTDANATNLTSDTAVNYRAKIFVDSAQPLSALHHTSDPNEYTVSEGVSDSLNLTSVSYFFANQGARTVVFISFEIPDTLMIYAGQQVIFNLGAIATDNEGETPFCVVREIETGYISNAFNSCNVSSLNTLILSPKDSINGNFTLELGFLKVSSNTEPNITLQLISLDGTSQIGEVSQIIPPSINSPQTMNVNNIAYNRLYSNPGDVSEVSFMIKPSKEMITLSTQIYVYFPDYYSDKLGYRNIWCTANDLPLPCSITRSRILNFASFPANISIGSSVNIKVYGILTPVVPVPAGPIFIGIDDDQDPSNLVEYIEIADVASIPYINNPLSILSFVASTKIIREKADYSITFMTDLSGVKANRVIAIDFPDRFGNTLRGQQGPSVLISIAGSAARVEVNTISFGSRLKIILPIDLEPITSYTFTLKDIVNYDYQTCDMDRPTLIIASQDQSTAVIRTAPSLWDGDTIDYMASPKLKTLFLTDVNGSILTNLSLTVGTFSQEIRIVPPEGEAFNSEIAFSTTENKITLLPSILTAKRGASYESFRVGVPIDFSPQTVLITFEQDESSIYQIYSPLPHLEVILINNIKNIIPTPAIKIMRGGTSIPYFWQLDQLGIVPYTELQIIANVNNEVTSPLSIVGSSLLSFGPSSQQGGFSFSLSSDADPSDPPSFNLSLNGTDLASYELESNQITVTVIDPIETAPTLNSLSIPNNYAPTRQEFILNVDQSASVFWYIAYQNKLNTTDCNVIRDTYNNGFQFDALSDTQDQYGVLYVYNENQNYTFEIDNLVSDQVYSFILCLVNQMDIISSVSGTFSTMNNQATLDLLTLDFDSSINRNQLASVVCLFNRDLQLDNLNVVAMDGTSCGTPSLFDNFEQFNYSSIVLYIYGNRRSDESSNTTNQLSQYVNIITNQISSDFLNEFNQAFSGAGILTSFKSIFLKTDQTYNPPVLDTSNTVTVRARDTYITVSGLKLTSGVGIFYGIADPDITTTPTLAQVRVMENADNIQVSGDAAYFTGDTVTLTFTGLLPETDYMVYFYGTNEDRTQYATTTLMSSYKTRTSALGGEAIIVNLSLILLGVLSMIVL